MLRFCFGASGAGKSTGLIKEIIDRSFYDARTDYLLIVPDQFTMQTQKDVVKMHPSHAIMNIDVLSFGRLSHWIFEETAFGSFSVLDDVGKSLVVRRVADILGDKLKVVGGNMHKPGYIDEVKSTISEFMQYGIGDEDLSVLEVKSSGKGALNLKIKDLRLLYSEFLNYINGKFITTEETLDFLCKAILKSERLKNSVVVFDGFTGFTPIQYRVIKQLMSVCREVTVSLTISGREDPYAADFDEHELFMLSKKTVSDILRLEYEVMQEKEGQDKNIPDFGTWRELRIRDNNDIFISEEPVKRLSGNAPLAFLEENLFRFDSRQYEGEQDAVQIYEASTVAEEIRQTMIKIKSLIREKNYAYRDIAIVCGSLGSYVNILERKAAEFGIPVYIDQNTALLLNPFTEYITSAINVVISGYKYEDVFHYIRSGMTDVSLEDADILENYVRALGIKGRKQWEDKFMRRMPSRFKPGRKKETEEQKDLELTEKLEGIRNVISTQLKPLFDAKTGTAKEITDALISVIESNNCEEKLAAYKKRFEDKKDRQRSKEYDQVYEKVMRILTQISDLVGDDKLTLSEYKDILSAGIADIEIGTIPQDVDRIIVGDIERTRLREVKVLFFMGVNDGAIPKKAGGGGILSDLDRQFLADLSTGIELAPTPRQQMYIQRLYLYMNLTKPTDRLYLSYAELDGDSKSMRPAYLISKITALFPNVSVKRPEEDDFISQTACVKDSMYNLSDMLRDYAMGLTDKEESRNLSTLYKILLEKESGTGGFVSALTNAAFKHYEDKPLAKMIALSLYGANLENSVSRLEQYASCCYAHFIKYGLSLTERKEYDFDVSDLGNVFHEVLEKFTGELISSNRSWRDLSKEESDELLNRTLTECVNSYGDTVLLSNARNQFMVDRIRRILTRTVDTLKLQITKGKFEPAYVEMDFRDAGELDEINIALTEDERKNITERMKLKGRIDRIDLCEDEDNVYVKVIDFKSGTHKFNIASLYYGLQLQLVMYMNVAVAVRKKMAGNKEVLPAAVLYYHVDDPMAEGSADLQPDDINREIIRKLRTTGLVNDSADVIRLLDSEFSSKSEVIPVEYKKDGSLSARSQTASLEDYSAISHFVDKKIKNIGKEILNGSISVNPYEMGQRNSCTYCSYKGICGFDDKIPGFKKRELVDDESHAMEIIREEYNKDRDGQ
ncbi:MAG: PD-(D/E)XK nuclease family protein [Butyrivibrio sp.]|nr:PD-(D/E)XK nuclease family protein [Butyrivibrio sp.]